MKNPIVRNITLKGHETYLQKLKGEREVLQFKLNSLNTEFRENKTRINEAEKRIRLLKTKDIIVSEHAILRYIERVEAIPPGQVPGKIITEKLRNMIETLGNGTYPMDGYSVKVRDNTIITVIV